jgi:hypothetical protein
MITLGMGVPGMGMLEGNAGNIPYKNSKKTA